MKLTAFLGAGALLAATLSPVAAQTVVFEQNFNEATVGTATVSGPGNDVFLKVTQMEAPSIPAGYEIQGGTGGGASLTAGIEAVGVGGTNALSANWDTTLGINYGWGQVSYYGAPTPTGGTPVHLVKVSLDIYMNGFNVTDPFEVVYQYPSADIPNTPGGRAIRATTTNDQFTTVSFFLNQTYGNLPPNFALFDTSSNLRFQYGQGGDGGTFGFDTNNLIRVDNIKIEVVAANADFNGDFNVDGNDFLIWQQNVGQAATTTFVPIDNNANNGRLLVNGDANGDGTVNDLDLAAWRAQYTGGSGLAAVPEPSAVALAGLAVAALAGRRRRSR
jgi:hypothetical protein